MAGHRKFEDDDDDDVKEMHSNVEIFDDGVKA